MRESPETFADSVSKVSKSPETFLKFGSTKARTRTCLPGLPKLRRQASQVGGGTAKSAPQVRELAEAFADFVDPAGKSPETFPKSDGTEAGSRTYLRGLPKLPRQTSQIGGGTAGKWSVAARCYELCGTLPELPELR